MQQEGRAVASPSQHAILLPLGLQLGLRMSRSESREAIMDLPFLLDSCTMRTWSAWHLPSSTSFQWLSNGISNQINCHRSLGPYKMWDREQLSFALIWWVPQGACWCWREPENLEAKKTVSHRPDLPSHSTWAGQLVHSLLIWAALLKESNRRKSKWTNQTWNEYQRGLPQETPVLHSGHCELPLNTDLPSAFLQGGLRSLLSRAEMTLRQGAFEVQQRGNATHTSRLQLHPRRACCAFQQKSELVRHEVKDWYYTQ